MRLSEIYEIVNTAAPKNLSDEYCARFNGYDNSGILVDTGKDVQSILFTLDLSNAAITHAIEIGANLIITHHPAIYGKIGNILSEDRGLLGGKLIRCIENGISVISMHLNLDTAEGGIDESLMNGICLSAGERTGACTRSTKNNVQIMHQLSEACGYGRAYDVEKTTLSALVKGIQTNFHSQRVVVYGEGKKEITRVASFCGAGADEGSVFFAKMQGAQVIISADFKHHVLAMAQELGLSVIVLTHYASENYGMKEFFEKIRQRVELSCAFHTDENLL